MANEHSQIVPSMQPTAKVADFKFWCQKVLPLVYDDSLSYYEVLNKMVVYLNQVIDNINADIDNVAELEDDFLLLQTYVNNFFDDIDQLVTYTERAEAAETAALSSAASAAESATNAASSAVNAATSSGSAATSALSALDAKDAAVAAKTAAEAALASAQSAATNATASATAASGSATNAAASAASALQNFQLSDAARTAAQSAATSAESDAESAADSAAEAVAAVDTLINGLGNISKTIENVPIATTEDALASIAKKLVVDIEPVQSGSGDPAPNNVRPITGWTGSNVMRTGKNLIHTNNLERAGANTLKKPFFSLPKGTYTFSRPSDGASYSWYVRKLETESYSPFENLATGSKSYPTGTFTLTENSLLYLEFYSSGGLADGDITGIQIEKGSTATTYEPYQGITIPITFPVEAGTVYGATLTNVGADEWKLIVNIAFAEKDLSTVQFTEHTVTKSASFNVFPANVKGNTYGNNKNTFLCNIAKYAYNSTDYAHWYSASNSTNAVLYIPIELDTSNITAQFTAELVTPIEYTLTETQALALLNGINNVWADTGNINTLEYFTNAENYVTSQINLAKALIAPVLKDMIADTALVANDFRIVGNTLYRITSNIASGGTLTPNTNCVATTVGAILKSLLSA